MSAVSALDIATAGLVRVAMSIFDAPETVLSDRMRAAKESGTPAIWLEELLLSSVLFVGYPRALLAAGVFRRLEPDHAEGGEASQYEQWRDWLARGEATCRIIYGKHYDKLRQNVANLHPALDLWMVVDGYGKTQSRPGLDLARRELCSVGMLIPQDAQRQLLSHMQGAINAGATPEQLDEVLKIAATCDLSPTRTSIAGDLWLELKHSLMHD